MLSRIFIYIEYISLDKTKKSVSTLLLTLRKLLCKNMTLFQKYFLYFIFTYFLFHSCFCFDSNLKRELIKSLAISKIKDFNFLTQTSILSNVSPECINDIKYIRTGLYNFEFWIIPRKYLFNYLFRNKCNIRYSIVYIFCIHIQVAH